jgi:hypothetical protein
MRLLTCILIATAASSMAADARWGLKWNAPDDCISAAELAAKAEERLGRSAFGVKPDYRIDGVMQKGTAPKWKARLTVVSSAGEVMGSREVAGDDDSCRALDGRLAFMVAVSIDPKAGPPASVTETTPAPPPAPSRASKPGAVWVEMESSNPNATLTRHLSSGAGMVGNTTVMVNSFSMECRAPCGELVEKPNSDFYIMGEGVTPSARFSLQDYNSAVKIQVNAGSAIVRSLSWVLTGTAFAALLLGSVSVVTSVTSQTVMPGIQNPYGTNGGGLLASLGVPCLIGGAVGMVGGILMFIFSGTKLSFSPLPEGGLGLRGSTTEI